MIRIIKTLFMVVTAIGFSSCHETIHIHPKDEPVTAEKVMLTLTVDNEAPKLGAIIDYTISPPVIVYSDNLPEQQLPQASSSRADTDDARADGRIVQRAKELADYFNQIAPYDLDGDKWELHLRYEVYAGTADQVNSGSLSPIYFNDVVYRADTPYPRHDVELELPYGDITVVAVSYMVPTGVIGDWFFNTTTIYNIVSIMEKRQGEYDNVYRDCFCAKKEFDLRPTGIDGYVQHISAVLTRPQGRYMVIADDYEAYVQLAAATIDNISSNIYYPSYINVAYSVLNSIPSASSYDFGYYYTPVLVYAGQAPYVRLGDDWSFVNGQRSNFNIDILVQDKDNDQTISKNHNVLVPVFPGRVTLVVGHWLTEINEKGGGIVIDPTFTDEIVIRF